MSTYKGGQIAAGSERQQRLASTYAPSMHLDSQPHLSQVSQLPQTSFPNQGKKSKQPKLSTAQELHKGWLENVRAEKRTMIKSLQHSLDRRETQNKMRAQELLDLELQSVASKEYDPSNLSLRGSRFRSSHQVPTTSQGQHLAARISERGQNLHSSVVLASPSRQIQVEKPARRVEQNVLSKMIAGRNQLYLEPFDVFDPHHPLRGKKRFDPSFRPLRSKINIKISAAEVSKRKRMNLVTVEQGVIDDFNKKYAENCDQKLMRIKNRNVSKDSPFDPRNKPPDQYTRPENVIEKPCKIDLSKIDASKVPLAGKLGTLGQKILSDFKNARQLTDYDWDVDCLMTEQIPRAVLGKQKINTIAPKLNQVDLSMTDFDQANFTQLHRNTLYPANAQMQDSVRLMNLTQQQPFGASASRQAAMNQFKTSQGSRNSPALVEDYQSIRDDMSTSPKSIRPTDKRVEFLHKAKQLRLEKKQQRLTERQRSLGPEGQTVTPSQKGALAWATGGKISPNRQSSIPSGLKRRLMTTEDIRANADSRNSRGKAALQTADGQSPRRISPGISEPLDMAISKILKSKNESAFTSSLLQGDHSKYAIGQGIQQQTSQGDRSEMKRGAGTRNAASLVTK